MALSCVKRWSLPWHRLPNYCYPKSGSSNSTSTSSSGDPECLAQRRPLNTITASQRGDSVAGKPHAWLLASRHRARESLSVWITSVQRFSTGCRVWGGDVQRTFLSVRSRFSVFCQHCRVKVLFDDRGNVVRERERSSRRKQKEGNSFRLSRGQALLH